MTSVICPTCGAACSLGGETTRYFIPPKDESERIVDLQRQLAEAKAEALEEAATYIIRKYGPKSMQTERHAASEELLAKAAEYRAEAGRKE